MKCLSCDVEINPKWSHAIDSNVCPFCGQNIMEENLKSLFSSLKNVMGNLQEYSSQLDDWMLSNYNYIKTDSPNLKTYLPKEFLQKENLNPKKLIVKVETENGEQEIETEQIQSDEKTNEFFKRAEAVKPNIDGFKSTSEKTKHLKNIVQQIKRGGTASVGAMGEDFISPDMIEQADPEAVAELQNLISGGNEVNSSLPGMYDDDNNDIPPALLAMTSNNSQVSGKDLVKLQQMHNKMKNSFANFESGANRGGRGGGFSRAG